MTLEQLKSLNEDELAVLSGIVNLTTPRIGVNGEDLAPSLFPCIKKDALLNRIVSVELKVTEEVVQAYSSLRVKLGLPEFVLTPIIPPIEPVQSEPIVETVQSGSVVQTES